MSNFADPENQLLRELYGLYVRCSVTKGHDYDRALEALMDKLSTIQLVLAGAAEGKSEVQK